MLPARPAVLLLLCACAAPVAAAPPRFTATEMMKLGRLSDVQPSPDGSSVAYTLTRIELAAGTRDADIWVVPLAGGEPRRLVADPASDTRPRD